MTLSQILTQMHTHHIRHTHTRLYARITRKYANTKARVYIAFWCVCMSVCVVYLCLPWIRKSFSIPFFRNFTNFALSGAVEDWLAGWLAGEQSLNFAKGRIWKTYSNMGTGEDKAYHYPCSFPKQPLPLSVFIYPVKLVYLSNVWFSLVRWLAVYIHFFGRISLSLFLCPSLFLKKFIFLFTYVSLSNAY